MNNMGLFILFVLWEKKKFERKWENKIVFREGEKRKDDCTDNMLKILSDYPHRVQGDS